MSYNLPDINRLPGLTSLLSYDFAVNFKRPASEFVSGITSVIAIPDSNWNSSMDDSTKPLHLNEWRLMETAKRLHNFICLD